MSKRMTVFKKTMVLLSMGAAFQFFGFPGGGGNWGCVTNTDLVNFYRGVGDAGVEAFRDSTANIIGSDFDDMVLTPSATFITAMWDNWVAQQFPLDVIPGTYLQQ